MTFVDFNDAQASVALVMLEFQAIKDSSGLDLWEIDATAEQIAKNIGFDSWQAFELEAERWGCTQWTKSEDIMAKRVLH